MITLKCRDENDWHFSSQFYNKIVNDLRFIQDNFVKVVVGVLKKLGYGMVVKMQLNEFMDMFKFVDIITQTKGK